MLAKSALVGLAAVLGLVPEMAQAACTECDVPEESVLLQNLQKRAEAELQPEWKSDYPEKVWRCAPDVNAAQYAWKNLILSISNTYASGGDFVDVAKKGIAKYYGYDIGKVLFKPTQAVEDPFRSTPEGALSYFVGCSAAGPACIPEDKGFAINAGAGWKKVRFDNDQVNCFGDDDIALAEGYYYFTNNETDEIVAVEYSFAYKRIASGELKIVLHHSSIPYKAPGNSTNSTNSTLLMQDVSVTWKLN